MRILQTKRIGTAKLLPAALVLAATWALCWGARAADLPAEVALRSVPAGIFFTDVKGHSLYTYDRDTEPSKSTCVAKCEETWQPVLASERASPQGDWTLATRANGSRQWAHRGKPLYTYVKDDMPEAVYGDRIAKVWHVAFEPIPTPPGIEVGMTLRGPVLTDSRGHTLYVPKAAQSKASSCKGRCLRVWEPKRAPWTAQSWGDWSAIDMGGGVRQWAFKGKPLYRYAKDENPGDVRGTADSADWSIAELGPPPPAPPFVTVQPSDLGPVLANAEGKTLYALLRDLDGIKRQTCDDACLDAHWRPLLAAAGTKPIGQWSLREADGGTQWTFKGFPVYVFLDDAQPGDTGGRGYASGIAVATAWIPILQSYLVDPVAR